MAERSDPRAVLDGFSPAVREWFATSYPEPTAPQVQGWPVIRAGQHALVCAPTGSGKTLTAFLSSLDRLVVPTEEQLPPKACTQVLYISPLRALAFDVEKNLRSPLVGIGLAAERLGVPFVAPTVAMRTGDTSARDRSALIRRPPDLLITTPESLYLMLTSEARHTLANVHTVIIDEIHAMAATKRGAHLMLSLERLETITARPPQRIGLSATQRPLEEVARFLGGARPVTIVDAGIRKPMELQVVVPVEDMGQMGKVVHELRSGPASSALAGQRSSIWPSIYPRILEQVLAHRSTIIFCNARRQAERLAARLNELALDMTGGAGLRQDAPTGDGDLVKAHHGSLAREQRIIVEDRLKRGDLRAIVATSSLELGIDMGAVDLVIQVESPGAVSRGLQRVGRAGHSVGEPSKGILFPKHRGDLLEAAVVSRRMREGLVESTRFLRNPLDVLAQQIVAHVCMNPDITVTEIARVVRGAACFADLSDDLLHNVLDLLAGRYPSDEFAELRPRLVWDRVGGTLRARDSARRLAVTNAGTIPDRGLFGVFLADGTRVGELDEEMVYESRPGDVFLLGASTWRIEDITFERVVVSPAPGEPAKMPFWHGDRPGRPLELGRALGAFHREVRTLAADESMRRLMDEWHLDAFAANNVLLYLGEQAEATGAVPDDRTIVIERFRDEIGDWRVCILSPFGVPVHAPWSMAIERRLVERYDLPVETMYTDDGIVLRLPESAEQLPLDALLVDPDEVDELVMASLPGTSLFGARFRECSARALLLPRRRPDQRTPLWQQRQRAHDLLSVAGKYPSFPMLLETTRECLQDVFDLPSLREVLAQIRDRSIRVVSVDTPRASPFSQSLLFNWIAAFMYEGDSPLAERRAAALALDRDLLRDLLGAEELRELLDASALAAIEDELQQMADGRRARSIDELHDLLRRVGDLTDAEIDVRCETSGTEPPPAWLEALARERRAIQVSVAGEQRWIAADDAARYRDALGCALPLGLPREFTEPVVRPLESLLGRYARTHGPFLAEWAAGRFGVPIDRVVGALVALEADGRIVRGEFRPGGAGREWCDHDVLRQIRRRSLAVLRREVEPVEQSTYARFLQAWHSVPGERRGLDGLVEALGQLQGAPLVASALETDLLPARMRQYRSADLDELCTTGELVWVGAGAIGASDGRIRLCFADHLPTLAAGWEAQPRPDGALHEAIRARLGEHGASFWQTLRSAAPGATDTELLVALWDLVWAGEVTNDSLAPLRAFLAGRRVGARASTSGRPRPGRLTRIGPPLGAGRWSLVSSLLSSAASPVTSTEAARATALQLLDRYGVVTREAALAEGVLGGYASVYPVLKVLEERGQSRRGYFVTGLGAAQFSLPGAVDRLRSLRDEPDPSLHPERVPPPVVLAATDPAQPYGAILPWPESPGRPSRSAGAIVVLDSGRPLVWFDRRSHHLVTFPGAVPGSFPGAGADVGVRPPVRWADALAALVRTGRVRAVEVRKVDGGPLLVDAPVGDILRSAGFTDGYRGMSVRA